MRPFKSILVDVDATANAHPGLDQAVSVSRQCEAHIKIVDVVNIPADSLRWLKTDMKEQIVSRRREQLAEIANAIEDLSADVDILEGRPAIALIREVLRSNHDLLVRSHARDLSVLVPAAYDAVDIDLFRQCPCPVWVVCPSAASRSPRLLAAVHANIEDPVEQELNQKIVEMSLQMTQLLQGSLTIMQAWAAYAEGMVRYHIPADKAAEYVDSARQAAWRDLNALTGLFGDRLSGSRIELRKGEPEVVIPRFVVTENIDLVVMGTVARTGISGLLIGNTAERLLQQLKCSILAIKPEEFTSPVKLDT